MTRRIRWIPRFVKESLQRRVIKPVAERSGYSQPERTSVAELTALLGSLHPVRTQCPLIRLGSERDGGYVVPEDLKGIAACFSPGVGEIIDFEEQCAARGMQVFMADGSIPSPPPSRYTLAFLPKNVGLVDTPDCTTLDTWIDSSVAPDDGDLILQMDIEGAEWMALAHISRRNLLRFRIIVVELHAFDGLIYRSSFATCSPVLRRLMHDFVCVHLHPNNDQGMVRSKGVDVPCVLEMTLLRKDRAQVTGYCSQFPHPLDRDNTSKPSVVLPASLFRQH